MDEVDVAGGATLETVAVDLALHFAAEVEEDPAHVGHREAPFHEGEDDEVVDSRVAVLVVVFQNLLFYWGF